MPSVTIPGWRHDRPTERVHAYNIRLSGRVAIARYDDKRVCVLVVPDRLVHEQLPNSVAVLSDRNEGGFLLVVCHRSLYEHRRDLVPIRSENDKLQAPGIPEVVRRFGTLVTIAGIPLCWCFGCSRVFPRPVPNGVHLRPTNAQEPGDVLAGGPLPSSGGSGLRLSVVVDALDGRPGVGDTRNHANCGTPSER